MQKSGGKQSTKERRSSLHRSSANYASSVRFLRTGGLNGKQTGKTRRKISSFLPLSLLFTMRNEWSKSLKKWTARVCVSRFAIMSGRRKCGNWMETGFVTRMEEKTLFLEILENSVEFFIDVGRKKSFKKDFWWWIQPIFKLIGWNFQGAKFEPINEMWATHGNLLKLLNQRQKKIRIFWNVIIYNRLKK